MSHRHTPSSYRAKLLKPSAKRISRPKHTWLDTWLPRLSHLSQFGLFLFTIATIYFTVIPLYQKALLDEAIAKKEIDLKEATAAVAAKEQALNIAQTELTKNIQALKETKIALEQAELRTYIQKRGYDLSAFVNFSGASCTGILIPVASTAAQEEKQPEPYVELLGIDPAECLRKEFQGSRLKAMLQPKDLDTFEVELAKTMEVLRTLRAKAIRDSEGLPAIAQRNPGVLSPPGAYEARMEAFLARIRIIDPLPPEEQRRRDFDRKIRRTRNALAHEYTEAARITIRKLGSVTWPVAAKVTSSP